MNKRIKSMPDKKYAQFRSCGRMQEMKGGNISDPKDSNGSQKGENCGLIYHEG